MADDINWQGVLQQVFAKYGAQLRRPEVKKFAAKFAKKQGRVEEKRDLKTSLKKFLSSDKGKKAVKDNNGMLSLESAGPPPQAAPVKFSLLDLAEAADKMSKEQLDLAMSTKRGNQAAKPGVTGRRTARKRKAMDTTNAPKNSAPSGSPAMLTRTQLRQQGSNLHEAVMAADATAVPVSAAPKKGQTSKQAAEAEQLNPSQRTATLLPNGEVLAHLPLSQRGQEKPQKQASSPHRQKQPMAPPPSADVKSASAASHLDSGAQPAQDTVRVHAEGGPDAVQQPAKKRKKQKHDKHPQFTTGAVAAADAQHASKAAAVEAVPAHLPASKGAAATDTGALAEASSSQQHKTSGGNEQPAVKTKKRKHKSKELSYPRLPAEGQEGEAAVVPEASHHSSGQADMPAGSLVENAEPAVKPKKKKKRKNRGPIRSATAVSHEQGHAIIAPVAMWPPSHAVPAEVEGPAGPAETDEVSVPTEPAGTSPKSKKQRSKVQAQADAAAPLSTATAALPGVTPAAAGSQASPSNPVSAPVETPAVKAKRKKKAKATVDNSIAPTGSTAAGTENPAADTAGLSTAEQPAVKAKRGPKAKTKAAAGAEPAGATPSASTGKAKRGRPPKSAARSKTASASGLVPTSWREDQARKDVKKGKFSKQEKDTLKQAAEEYAQEHSLPSNDFSWLFNTRTSEHKSQAAGAWQVIAQSLPHRTYKAVYACGTRMLHELNYQGKWSKEEDDKLRELVTERGPQWRDIGIVLGRLPEGCRDRWRDIKLGSRKQSGKWSEEESEKLRSLVSEYLALKQTNEGNAEADAALSLTMDDLVVGSQDTHGQQADGRIILDDIDWDVISARHGSRSAPQCLTKWYTQLAPSMVSKGDWGSGDDRRLLKALLHTGATHEFQVDWGNLIARNAAQTRRRWRLMLKCVKNATDHEFHENLLTLVQNFTPDLLPSDGAVEGAAAAAPADMAVKGA